MLSQFHMKNFRSCPDWKFSFGKKTYIMGENGSGKTHILDAIHLLAGSSLVFTDKHIDDGTWFEGVFETGDLGKRYTFFQDKEKRFYAIQGAKTTKPKYLGALPFRTVFVSPFDMNLLYFAPSARREFIDNILERAFEQFGKTRRDYEQVMRQRNALLKRIKEGEAQKNDLEFWDSKFAEIAEMYLRYRDKVMSFFGEHLGSLQATLPKYHLHFHYESSVNEKKVGQESEYATIIRYLQENRERDILSGHTHIGPHRDDFHFQVETSHGLIDVAEFLSRGEMKMLLLELKKLEVQCIEKYIDLPILLLVDDIFAELDEKNIIRFLNSLTTYQTILTSQKPLPEEEKWSDFICINLKDI